MADHSEEHLEQTVGKGADHELEVTDALRYPKIPLDASFDSLLKNSYPSEATSSTPNMTRTTHSSQPAGLSESWASMSDADLSQNDELLSEQTDNESLVDVRPVDDTLSVEDDDPSEHDDEETDDFSDQGEQLSGGDDAVIQGGGPQGSSLAEEHSLLETDLLPAHITLEEPRTTGASETAHVRHTLRTFTSQEILSISSRPEDTALVGAIDLTLHRMSLKDNGCQALRLLLLGQDHQPDIRESIRRKVGDALVTSGRAFSDSEYSSPSRYHVIPGSFGPGSLASTAELIPMSQHFEVQNYHSVELSSTGEFVLFEQTPGKTLESRPTATSLSYDLAIIITNTSERRRSDASLQLFSSLTRRYDIPTLVIDLNSSWDSLDAFCPFEGVAHRVVVSRPVWQDEVVARLPLDFDTFINLNAGQLSRHLSWLKQNRARAPEAGANDEDDAKLSMWMDRIQYVHNSSSKLLIALIPCLLVGFLIQCCLSFYQGKVVIHSPFPETDSPSAKTLLESTVGIPSNAMTASVSPSTTTTIAYSTVTAGCGHTFEIAHMGKSHIVIRTPLKKNNKLQLKVNVERDGEPVQTELVKLAPCVYDVQIPHKHVYDPAKVSLDVPSRQHPWTVRIDLGPEPPNAWITRVGLEADEAIQRTFTGAMSALQGLGQPDFLQRYVYDTAHVVKKGIHKLGQAAQFEERVQQPLRRLDRERLALNERLDAAGEDIFIQMRQWIAKQKPHMPEVRGKAGRLFREHINQCKKTWQHLRAVQSEHLAVDAITRRLQREEMSARLATAQSRVKRLVADWQERREQKKQSRMGGNKKCCCKGKSSCRQSSRCPRATA